MPQKNHMIRSNSDPIFTIQLSNGINFYFNLYTTDKLLKASIDTMKKINPEYIKEYRKTIKQKCKEYLVDPDNFSFNDTTLSEFKQADEKILATARNKITGKWNKKNHNYVMKILATIPKEILELKIENNISLNQYFQEIVVDRMDENYNYINDDMSLIPVSKLIIDKIRKVSIFEKRSEKNFYYVMGIISTVNKEVLSAKIDQLEELYLDKLLYNNITLGQYFQEIVVNRMDENQNFIKLDGTLIPGTDYIMSLINKIQTKNIDTNKKL